MEKRNLFKKIFGTNENTDKGNKRYEFVSTTANHYYPWSKNIWDSDIVRACIRPIANAVGKTYPKHIRGIGESVKFNPSPQIRLFFEEPNPYMSMQDFLTKMVIQRELTNNAFAYIKKDGAKTEMYPIPYNSLEFIEVQETLFVKFRFITGKYMTVPYTELIHLRKDYSSHDILGDSNTVPLTNVMEVINTTDQGIVNAVKNSAVVKWIMMYKAIPRKEDVDAHVNEFVKSYLAIDKSAGVAVSDPRYDLKQVDEKSYVPNALHTDKAVQRLYSYFGVNENIVQNKYTEDEWNAFYESIVEPIIIQISNAFTKAFFNAKERAFGNKIILESSNLAYASMSTKLNLVQMVDRGAMTPNEWRQVLNLGPIEGGEKPIRRLDTALVNEKEDDVDVKEGNKDDGDSSGGADT